jgi:AcrR family transcriptional regulator
LTAETIVTDGKSRILSEARTLFLERGFAETSMQDIADASGLTKAALYYHFHDKEELFSKMAFLEMDRIRKGLEPILATNDPLQARLTRAGEYLFASMEGDLPRLLVEAFTHLCAADRSDFAANRARFIDEAVVPVFGAAAEAGEIRADLDPRLPATFWLGMIFDQFKARLLGAGLPISTSDLSAIIASVLLEGIGTQTGSSRT